MRRRLLVLLLVPATILLVVHQRIAAWSLSSRIARTSWLRWRHKPGERPSPRFNEAGVQLLPRLHLPRYSEAERCYAHGVFPYAPGTRQPKRFPPRRVYDVVLLLDDRVDLLEVRFRELADVVDTFVVVEAATTMRGELRTPRYEDYAQQYLDASFVERVHYTLARAHGNERTSRFASLLAATDDFLKIIRIPSDSLMIQTLAEDIPSAATIKLVRNCTTWPWPVRLATRGRAADRNAALGFEPHVVPFDTTETRFGRPTDEEGPGSILPEAGWHWPGAAPHCSRGAVGTAILPAWPDVLADPPPHLRALASAACDDADGRGV